MTTDPSTIAAILAANATEPRYTAELRHSNDAAEEYIDAQAEILSLKAELQAKEQKIASLRSELATGYELAASVLSPQFDGAAYYDTIMDSLRTWLRRGAK